ncbi:unnamed protein product [Closterium sp. Yama58-4]|nr:unnamed protein product [Closterium sp. Yama58-4]
MQPTLGPSRDEPRVFGLDKFNVDNFAEWSFRMENVFGLYDLLEVMEGTDKRPENDPEKSSWVSKSAQGYLLLGQALRSSQIHHIKPFQREPEKGPKAWAALKGLANADGARAASIGRGYGRGRGRGRGGGRFGGSNFSGGRKSGGYGSDVKSYSRGSGRFDGECHNCHKSRHMWRDSYKLLDGWIPAQGQEGRGAGGGRGRGRGGRGGRGGGAANMKNEKNYKDSRDDRYPGQFYFVSTQVPAGPEKDEGFEEPAAVGKRAEVKGMGKAMFKGAEGKMVGLKNVLWVPSLAENLISVRRLAKAGMDTNSKGDKTYTARIGDRILWDLHEDKDFYNEMWQIPVVPMPKERQVAVSVNTKGDAIGRGDGANGCVKENESKKCNLGGTSKLGEHKESGAAAKEQHKGEENPEAATEEDYRESMWGAIASAAFSHPTSATGECDYLSCSS